MIDAVWGLSMIRRRESPSVQALLTSILPTGRIVVELPICSVNTESRFGAVAASSFKVGIEDPLAPCSMIATRSSRYDYPGRHASSSNS